jgi:predicted Zn-dependent peptidase
MKNKMISSVLAFHRDRLRMILLSVGIMMGLLPAALQAQFDELQNRIQEFTLSNGLKFIVLERHDSPVVSFYTYADVGAAQETKGITGLAHMFEHMAFKGSPRIGTRDYAKEKVLLEKVEKSFQAYNIERRKGKQADQARLKDLEKEFKDAQAEAGKLVVPNEFGEAIERAGGRGLNASTGSDLTQYFFSLPSNASELWFFLESERYYEPVFREFYKERNVVMEERRMRTESNPMGKAIEEFLSVAYKAHPYGEPVIGHMSDLMNISSQDAQAFAAKYYVPSNLTAVVVGDITLARVRELAAEYFDRIPTRPKPEPLRTVEPPQDAEKRITMRLRAQRMVLMGYHKPDISVMDPDNQAFEAISSILADGRSSRLYRSLVRDKQVAVQAGGFSDMPGAKYPGLFMFYAVTASGKTNEEAEKAIQEEIKRLTTEKVSAEELEGVKKRARAGLLRSMESNSGLAEQLGTMQGLTGDWRNLFVRLKLLNAVTPEDISRVAKATFLENNKTVLVIEPLETTAANTEKQ